MHLLLSILFFWAGTAWAKPSPCELRLDPAEAELAVLMHQMHLLRKGVSSAQTAVQMERLNTRALDILSHRLSDLKMDFNLVARNRQYASGSYTLADEESLRACQTLLETQACEYQMRAVQAGTATDRRGFENAYV